jgi:hypothetical protein
MSGLAAVTRELVPDVEGPVPVKPLRTSELVLAFGDQPSRGTLPKARRPDRSELAPPDLGSLLGTEEATMPVYAHETVEVEAPGSRAHHAPDTAVDHHGHADYASEAPTAMAMAPRGPMGIGATDSLKPVRPRRRKRGQVERALLVAGSAVLVVGVGVAAFVTARAISGSVQHGGPGTEPTVAAAGPPDARVELEPDAGAPAIRFLTVTSEPPGATIFLDGAEASLTTPATVPVPEGRDRVVVRTVLANHVTEEREILATSGEARFVLTRLSIDAGVADAGSAEGAGPTKRIRRIRRRRR